MFLISLQGKSEHSKQLVSSLYRLYNPDPEAHLTIFLHIEHQNLYLYGFLSVCPPKHLRPIHHRANK